MPNLTKEFIQKVREYREETGCILKESIKHVERLILSGKENFSKYEDPDIHTADVKPAIKLLHGEVIYLGYKNEYSAIVDSIHIDGEKEKILVSISLKDGSAKEIIFNFDDFVRLSPYKL